MLQELLGGSNVSSLGGEKSKPEHSSPSATASPCSSGGGAAPNSAAPESLRCPRCDSANTKFCYYNNYNLTQPRHFCKTCRRYWTKGGALRNVPIGGGCRKNKTAAVAAAVAKSTAAGKYRTHLPETGKSSNPNFSGGFEHMTQNPILWSTPQNSHLLSLLRTNSNPNPNPNIPLFNHVKEQGGMFGSESHTGFNSRVIGSDPFGPINHVPSVLEPVHSFYRNNQTNQLGQSNHGIILGEVQNNGLQELYQRLRSTSNCYPESAPVIFGNVSSSSPVLESAPVGAGGELGFWNSTLSWPVDLSTANGAYP